MKLKTLLKTMSETRYTIIVKLHDDGIPEYDYIRIDYLSHNISELFRNIEKRDSILSAVVRDIHYNSVDKCLDIRVDLGE